MRISCCAVSMPRSAAENDPSYKQLIPYIILRTERENQIGCYRRKGSEKRLHDLWSCGIGGHVNPIDTSEMSDTLEDILHQGLMRELNEEITSLPLDKMPVFRGIINEDDTEVGAVHLGLVYTLDVKDPHLIIPGEELDAFTWLTRKDMRSLTLELWAVLALRLLENLQV